MNCTVSMISLLHSKLWLKTEWQKWGCLSTPGPRPAWRPCPCRGWEERAASRPPLPVPFPSSLPPLTSPSAWLLEGRQNSSLPWLLLGLTKLMTTFPPPPPSGVRGPVKSRLSRSASHSSRLGCWPGSGLPMAAGCPLVCSFAPGFPLLPLHLPSLAALLPTGPPSTPPCSLIIGVPAGSRKPIPPVPSTP